LRFEGIAVGENRPGFKSTGIQSRVSVPRPGNVVSLSPEVSSSDISRLIADGLRPNCAYRSLRGLPHDKLNRRAERYVEAEEACDFRRRSIGDLDQTTLYGIAHCELPKLNAFEGRLGERERQIGLLRQVFVELCDAPLCLRLLRGRTSE
jgi:hypothetical protein